MGNYTLYPKNTRNDVSERSERTAAASYDVYDVLDNVAVLLGWIAVILGVLMGLFIVLAVFAGLIVIIWNTKFWLTFWIETAIVLVIAAGVGVLAWLSAKYGWDIEEVDFL